MGLYRRKEDAERREKHFASLKRLNNCDTWSNDRVNSESVFRNHSGKGDKIGRNQMDLPRFLWNIFGEKLNNVKNFCIPLIIPFPVSIISCRKEIPKERIS